MKRKTHIRQTEPFRWEGVPVLAYKEDEGARFRAVTRQVLFGGDGAEAELRYFEVAPGGHSTLERHAHVHSVMVVRGRGHALVGREIHELAQNSLVYVPPMTWHQFRATGGEPLGFLCLVRSDRDRPQRPAAGDLEALRADAAVGAFIRV
jgi:mannose-6-phosphate isomerase-like protein (cupin superfamily)